MEKKHLFNLTTEELETIVINCVNSCLKHNTSPVSNLETNKILTIKPAAASIFITVPTLRLKVKNGEISCMKRGGKLYFSEADLLNYLKEGRRKTSKEIAEEADEYLKRNGGK
jgi:hypothetical protein